MKKLLSIALTVFLSSNIFAQLTTAPNGGNKKAMVGERIGLTDVTINYDRPGVKGREGKIWGELIPVGYTDQGFGPSKAAPWRTGANENTTIEFSTDVKVEGKDLPAGKYALFIAYDPNESTIIFSKNSTSWGSFFYEEKEDALRVKVKPLPTDYKTEWMKFEFLNQTTNSADIAVIWEKLMISFKVEVDYINQQLASFRRELRNQQGFTWKSWDEAAAFAVQNNVDLEEALIWADKSISLPFIGEKNFRNLSTKAQVLVKLNRKQEADSIMKAALPLGNEVQIHTYARELLIQKRNKDAFDAFKMNYDKNPNTFTTNMGMARGYSAIGNYKKALEFARKALPQAPDPGNKGNVTKMIKTLEEGKDINQ